MGTSTGSNREPRSLFALAHDPEGEPDRGFVLRHAATLDSQRAHTLEDPMLNRNLRAALFLLLLPLLPMAIAFLPGASTADAQGSCCRYVIAGCDREAKVCVPDSCGSNAERRARSAFESANSCRSSSTRSYIGTCSNERCDIDLR